MIIKTFTKVGLDHLYSQLKYKTENRTRYLCIGSSACIYIFISFTIFSQKKRKIIKYERHKSIMLYYCTSRVFFYYIALCDVRMWKSVLSNAWQYISARWTLRNGPNAPRLEMVVSCFVSIDLLCLCDCLSLLYVSLFK